MEEMEVFNANHANIRMFEFLKQEGFLKFAGDETRLRAVARMFVEQDITCVGDMKQVRSVCGMPLSKFDVTAKEIEFL